jgi:hypothetical protein
MQEDPNNSALILTIISSVGSYKGLYSDLSHKPKYLVFDYVENNWL